jgi:hypothetical protein
MWRRKKNYSFRIAVLSPLLTGAAIIAFWRGLWGLMDLYVFPEEPTVSFLVTFLIGIVILYLNDFNLNEIKDK